MNFVKMITIINSCYNAQSGPYSKVGVILAVALDDLQRVKYWVGVSPTPTISNGNISSFKSPVKNYRTSGLSCQGSVQSADLHALDSNKRHIFHPGVREKELFHHPLKMIII